MELLFCNRIVKNFFPHFDVVKAQSLESGEIICEGISEREFHSIQVSTGKITGYCHFSELKGKNKISLFYDYDCKNKIAIDPIRAAILSPVSSKILVNRVTKMNFRISLDGKVKIVK